MPTGSPHPSVFRSILAWTITRPWVSITCFAAISLFFWTHIPRLSFHTSIYDLLVENLSDSIRYRNAKTLFGSDEIIRVVITAEDIFDPATFSKIEALSEAFSRIEGIKRVISLSDIRQNVDPGRTWTMEQFAQVTAPVGLITKNLISDDRRAGAITLFMENDADQEKVIANVNDIILREAGELRAYPIGMPLVSKALVEYTVKDFKTLPILTLCLITLTLLAIFRKLRDVLLTLMVLGLVVTWTFGFMALLNVPVSLLMMIVPVFLIAVGTAYCLHVLSGYGTSARLSTTAAEAVAAAYANSALPCTLAVVTTSVGVGSLFVNHIRAIHEFALFACFGMGGLLLALLLLLPSVLVLLPLPVEKAQPVSRLDALLDRILDLIVVLGLKHRKAVFTAVGAATLLAAGGIFLVEVETNPFEYLKEDTPIRQNFEDSHRRLSGSFAVSVTMESRQVNYFEDPQHLSEIKDFQNYLETLSGVDKTISFADYIMMVQYALNNHDASYYRIPQEAFEMRMAVNNYKGLLGEDMFSRFMTPELNKANILMLTHLSSSKDYLHIRDEVLAHAQQHLPEHLSVEVTGFGVAISASSHLLAKGQINSILVGLGLIFTIMFMMFLSAKVGLIALIPNCFPIVMNFGIMGWLGIPFSAATSLIASIAIGLAVDDTIHYLHRYNHEFKKDLDKDRALRDTVKSVGKPIIFTTLTIGIGFFVLMFSQFKPTAIFGFLMVVTMLTALIGDLILLPGLMLHVELVTAWDLLKLMPTTAGMSSGVAHELNQPLNAIKMGSDFLKMMIARKTEIQERQLLEVVDEIGHQVDRAAGIVNRLQAFGQRPDLTKHTVDINDPVEEVMAIVGHQLSLDNIGIELDLAGDLPPVSGHSNRLGQVVYNLLSNAQDAINERKTLGTGTGRAAIRVRTFSEGGEVILTVSDTGIGIPPHNLGRIYEPFFSTKGSGQGKGLGLSIVHQIVRDFGGRIDVESREHRGSTFRVAFPSAGR